VPMLLGGDELSRTQHGNNNAWCQDNEISWYEWGLREGQGDHLEFTKRLIELRKAHPVFRRGKFLAGRESEGSGLPDVWWFRPDGRRMTQRDWQQPSAHVLGVFLNGQEIADRTPRGAPIEDGSFLLLFNAHHEDMTFTLPARRFGAEWIHEICTHEPALEAGAQRWSSRGEVLVPARSMKLLLRA
jgi:isoamylase